MYSNKIICKTLEYINQNINKEITITEISNILFYDRTYIMKKFKKEIGITINNYISITRIYNSLILFKYNYSILNIALRNGFNSQEYFSETFKKYIGVSPITYRNYIMYSPNITAKQENQIKNSISELFSIKNKCDDYIKNQKIQKNQIKKITL